MGEEGYGSRSSLAEHALAAVHELVVATDAEGRVVLVNDALAEFLGSPRAELEGLWAWELLAGPAAEAARSAFAAWGPRIHEVLPESQQLPLKAASGSVRTITWSFSTLRDAAQRSTHVLACGLDVTDRHELELRLQLNDRILALGTLAAGIAHEINNPLTYTSSNLELLRRKLDGADPALLEALDEALEGAQRVRRIVRDLGAFARPEEQGIGPVDVVRVVESALNMARHELRHRAELVLDLQPVPVVRGTESRLGQVVLNLLVNAAHAITPGHADQHRVSLRTGLQAEQVVIEVRDTGAGIAEADLPRIFDPFFTTKAPGQGTGLGLSISSRIVHELGGRIEVESELGRGTHVRVLLPRAGSSLPPASREPVSVRGRLGGLRILVVDDEPAVLRATRRLLAGNEVVTARSGREALELLQQADAEFDAILCDVLMPDLTGVEVWQALGADPPRQRRMVLMTGSQSDPELRRFLEQNDVPRLSKPFTTSELNRVLEDARRRGAG